jgi:hypothetical protein
MTKIMFYTNRNHAGLFRLSLTFKALNFKTNT